MAGAGVSKLPRRKGRFSPIGRAGFESKVKAHKEDQGNAKRLRGQACRIPDNPAPLETLAEKIDPAVTNSPNTPASARFMRDQRLRVVPAVWRLYAEYPEARTFTIIPRGWVYRTGELGTANPRKMLEQVRSALNRAGLGQADGWAFLAIHGEYNPLAQRFTLHLHGVGCGGVLAAVERLKGQRAYRSRGSGNEAIRFPVRISRSPLTNLPAPLTYLIQAWWPCRVRGDDRQITPSRRRIPEPAHTEYLLWLDQWRIEDLTLLIKLRVVNGKLSPRL